jgi:hypothetical protein
MWRKIEFWRRLFADGKANRQIICRQNSCKWPLRAIYIRHKVGGGSFEHEVFVMTAALVSASRSDMTTGHADTRRRTYEHLCVR